MKMNTEQYLKAGEHKLGNERVYKQSENDQINLVVDHMVHKGEIPEKVGEFLKDGETKVAKYYHLLKTHKIPQCVENPAEWLEEHGFPIRGIVSCYDTPQRGLQGL